MNALAVDDPPIERQLEPPGRRYVPWRRFVGLAGLVLAAIGLARADPSHINGLGLVRVPQPLYYVGLALVLVWTVREIASPTRRAGSWFMLGLGSLVVLLQGLPALVEHNPRFPVAYIHVGFTDQIATHGQLLPLLDARFSWPSFFAGNALLQKATGGSEVLWVVRFTPVVVTLLACAATMALGRLLGISGQRVRVAAVIFTLLNWVGQDYFAPQAVGYVIYLVVICCVLLVFPGRGPREDSWLYRLLRPRPIPQLDVPVRVRRTVLVLLVFVIGVLVTTHQLTPGFLAISLILLAVVNATRLRTLGLITAAMTVGWLSFAAEAYWIGHTSTLFGSAGNVGLLVQQNIGKRTTGGADRTLVLLARFGLSGVVLVAVIAAVVILWRRHDLPVPLVVLAAAPIPLLGLQSYGGEMILRVFFFLLPAGSLLLAEVFTAVGRWRLPQQLLTTVIALAVVPVFLVARFGNESFEQVTSGDRAVLSALYAQAPDGTVVYVLNAISIEYLQRVDQVRFRPVNPHTTAKALLGRMEGTRNLARELVASQYVMVNHTQEAAAVALNGLPPGWSGRTVTDLLNTGHYTVVLRQSDSVLLRFIPKIKRSS